jgi:rubrerythrin
MGPKFNANEVFEMAEEIERNAARFYRQAAESSSDNQTKKMLLDLADMEDGHQKTFAQMREQLKGEETGWSIFDPDNLSVMYLQAMADSRGYEGRITPTKELTGTETPKEILEIALNSEKESVFFYFGLKGLVPARAGGDKIEAIIKEELSHITTLLNKLKSL